MEPLTELPWERKKLINPPGAGLLNAPTIWLLLQVKEAPEAIVEPFVMNDTLLLLFRFRLVKVLFKILVDSTDAFWFINPTPPVPVTA